MPRLFIIAGCNGSGKTTASYSVLPEMLECTQYVNSDEFAKSLSPFDPDSAAVSAGRYMVLKIRYLFDRKQDFCIETTLATRSLLRMVRKARTNGYSVTLIYLWLNSPETAISRVSDRVAAGGHNTPEPVIRRRYFMGLKFFFNEYIPECDRWILADNTNSPFSVVAEGNHSQVHIKDNAKFDYIWNQVNPDKKKYGEDD